MRILVSNDDGVYSPGIAALAQVAAEFGTVRVVAPDVERSSSRHAVSASRPLSYRQTRIGDFTAYRIDGTPADCVALGSHLWGEVDLVLSGLNLGLNVGASIWHSGTLAAAKEGTLLGKRGVALSAPMKAEPDFAPLLPWVRKVLDTILPDPALRLVNVNFPREPRGLLWTRVSVRHDGKIVPTHDPMGRESYWFAVSPRQGAEEGTDRWALEQGWISMTPLRLDLTDEVTLARELARNPLDLARAAQTSAGKSTSAAARSIREDEAKAPLEEPR